MEPWRMFSFDPMTTPHTPGPWLNGWGKVTDSEGKAICMVIHRKNGDNARLIASAPELLSALELVFSNAGESPEWIRSRIAPVISKAKGLQ